MPTQESTPTPTGSSCPDDSTLTYATFGEAFMTSYCVGCHSSQRSGDDRNGAPAGHDFDTLEGIVAVAEHIDEHAAAGPEEVNELMPPSDPRPTDEEREALGEWLACGTP